MAEPGWLDIEKLHKGLCQDPNCGIRANFNYEGETRLLYCKRHKKPNMTDVAHKKCEVCKEVIANFGLVKGKPTHCTKCKTDNMFNVVGEMCRVCKQIEPNFALERGKRATHCGKCKSDEMFDVRHKLCQLCKKIRPSYGLIKGKPTHCAKCKTEEMLDVISKMCEVCQEVLPVYGLVKGKRTHCSKCKSDEMFDVKSKMCQMCKKIVPHYGLEKGKATHCVKCKTDDMFDVKTKMCQVCKEVRPHFGLKGGKPTHCSKCKAPNMFDVKHSMCHCGIRSNFGYPSQKPSTCAHHKKEGMISHPRKRCIVKKCKEFAIYGKYNGKHKHCEEHRDNDEVNLIEFKCQSCDILQPLNEDRLCIYCANPEAGKRIRFAKQMEVKNYLDNNDYEYVLYDRIPYDTTQCGLERPDFLFDCGTHYLDLEVDEDQHKGRPELCDCNRMVNVSQALGLKTIFIRYNPDDFKTNNKKYDPSFNTRMKELRSWLDYYMETVPEDYCSFIQLYYDGYVKGSVEEIGLDLGFRR